MMKVALNKVMKTQQEVQPMEERKKKEEEKIKKELLKQVLTQLKICKLI